MTKYVKLNELSESVRTFLDEALAGEGTVIEDERGRTRGRVVPVTLAPTSEQDSAWRRLKAIQRKTRQRMLAAGRTEGELDRILQGEE
ncbi:MAG: hypothetical protein WD069_02825 [Planctomycetales bacterium]